MHASRSGICLKVSVTVTAGMRSDGIASQMFTSPANLSNRAKTDRDIFKEHPLMSRLNCPKVEDKTQIFHTLANFQKQVRYTFTVWASPFCQINSKLEVKTICLNSAQLSLHLLHFCVQTGPHWQPARGHEQLTVGSGVQRYHFEIPHPCWCILKLLFSFLCIYYALKKNKKKTHYLCLSVYH